jgi:hypothetical protein
MISKATQIRVLIMKKMKMMLPQWIQHQHPCAIPLSTMIIQTKQLIEFFKHTDTATVITDDNDANRERSAKVTRVIESAVACYKELYSKRQKAACWLHRHHFFKRAESCPTTGPARQLVLPDHATHSPATSESSN